MEPLNYKYLVASMGDSPDVDESGVCRFEGKIFQIVDPGQPALPIGLFLFHVLDFVHGSEHGYGDEWLFDTLAAHQSYFQALYKPNGRLKPAVLERVFGRAADQEFERVLILDWIQVAPSHRGRQIGQWVYRDVVRFYGAGCQAVLVKPEPFQFTARYQQNPAGWEGLNLPLHLSEDQARAKLIERLSRDGFKRVGATQVYLATPEEVNQAYYRDLRVRREKWRNNHGFTVVNHQSEPPQNVVPSRGWTEAEFATFCNLLNNDFDV